MSLGTYFLESLTFLGFTLVSALHEIANKHLIPAAFAPVASSCCSVYHKVLWQRDVQGESSSEGWLLEQLEAGEGYSLTFGSWMELAT